MMPFNNKYNGRDEPLCPCCNWPVHPYDDTVITKAVVETITIQYLYHLHCYDKKVINGFKGL